LGVKKRGRVFSIISRKKGEGGLFYKGMILNAKEGGKGIPEVKEKGGEKEHLLSSHYFKVVKG